MVLDLYRWSGNRRLRCGYTTGTCAALATQAACTGLLRGAVPPRARVTTPGGVVVEAEVLDATVASGVARCAVRKDGGDDVDATDGMLIYVEARRSRDGIAIDGGEGIGRVTQPGLEQPVGEAAINSVPRAQIAAAAREVCAACGYKGGVALTVSAPEGERIAERTFNPRLGIRGGISILGTTGIVEPRSLDALRRSVELEVSQAIAAGARDLLVTPGNYGEAYIERSLPRLDVPMVVCSNFIGAALDAAVHAGAEGVLVVGHIGKMVKVAAGVMDTHSQVADARLETLAAHAALAGAGADVVRAIMESPTTDAVLDAIAGAGLLAPVSQSLAQALGRRLAYRAERARADDAPPCMVAAIVFSNVRGELFRTDGADELLARMRRGHA